MAQKEKTLNIRWASTAELQFLSILEFWIEHNKSTTYAEKLSELVWEKTRFLAKNPMAGPESAFPETRKAAMGHYSIYYRIVDTEIIVTAFWDNRQDPKKLFDLLNE